VSQVNGRMAEDGATRRRGDAARERGRRENLLGPASRMGILREEVREGILAPAVAGGRYEKDRVHRGLQGRQGAVMGRWMPGLLAVAAAMLVGVLPASARAAMPGGLPVLTSGPRVLASDMPVLASGLPMPASTDLEAPAWDSMLRVVTLRDYNTRVVVLGTMLLGLAAGVVGTFMLLHKQALLGDALSHATLPGIGLAFIFAVMAGGTGKSLGWLLTGAVITGVMGVGCILLMRHFTRLKQDTALGIVLSVFFGAGVAILGVIQKMQTGHAAGLESFIYGKTASMRSTDAWLIAATAALVIVGCIVLLKELLLVCFDQHYAKAQGWPVVLLEILLMAMVTAVTVIGLQAVGLILIVALLIIPPAAARFWTHRLIPMLLIAAGIGAGSAAVGAGASAVIPKLPSGATIVVVAAALFMISMIFAPARGALVRWLEQARLHRRIARQHLLRALYEHTELTADSPREPVSFADLLEARSWPARELQRALASARSDGEVAQAGRDAWSLTESGIAHAARLTRNHRLWELYLIHYADVAPSHVDRDAEEVEHVLGGEMIDRLEELLAEAAPAASPGQVPASPHDLTPVPTVAAPHAAEVIR